MLNERGMPKRNIVDINVIFDIIIKIIGGLILFWFMLLCVEMV